MTSLTRLSLANRLIVGLLTLAILVSGVFATLSLKQELLPSITAPTAFVTANYTGVSPQIVAKDVSTPIEQAVLGVSGVTRVQSTSINGLANITAEWEYGLDSDKLLSDIRSAVDSASIPDQVTTQVLTGSTDDIPVLLLAVASDAPLERAGDLVENVAVPALSAVDGVRQVELTGQNETQLQVTLRPKDLRRYDLTPQAVTESIRAQAAVLPAGTSYAGNTELAVEVGTAPNSVQQVQAMSIASADGPVKLGRLADVRVAAVDSTSVARSNGRPALGLTVLKETDADSVEISHAVNDLLPGLEQKLGSRTTFTTVFDQAPLIEQSIDDLAVEGGLGLAFAVLTILLFLFSLRSTIITAISIPLSLLIAMVGLKLGDFSLNIFTLAALTVAVGRVVDDSIVVIENIKRRATGQQRLSAGDILASVREVAGAVTASTLTTVAVFAPVAVVSGVVGELFRPFAITVAVALAASLLVSMTIVPVLAFWFLRRGALRQHQPAGPSADAVPATTGEESKVTRLQRSYLPVLRLALRHRLITLGLALVVFAGTLASATLLKTDFLGSVTDQTTLQVTQELPVGTRLTTTSEAAKKLEGELAGSPLVGNYLTTIGGSGIPGVAGTGSNVATITVTLTEGNEADKVRPDLQRELQQLKNLGEITVSATNNGASNSDVTVTVTGDNSVQLRRGAQQVEQLLRSVDGLTDVRSNLGEQRKLLKVDVNRTEAAKQGFTQAEVGQAVAGALRGTEVGTVTLQGETRDLYVRTQAAGAADPADIANLVLPVSQLQQQKAQEKASDTLADKQEKVSEKAQREADEALADQQKELRKQRNKARDALADTRRQLRRLKANRPEPPAPPRTPTAPPAQQRAPGNGPTPGPSGPPSQGGGVPVTTEMLEQQRYAEQVQEYAKQVAQLTAAVEQAEEGIEQLDEQIEATGEQADKTAEQREESEELQDEQEALADVRAAPITVADIAKVTTVLAPTTVTQIDAAESVTVTATPTGADLGALTETLQQRLDADGAVPAGVTATLGGASEDQQEAFTQLGVAMLAAIGLVFVIMVATFRSLIQPLILMVSIPFAATGAVAALLITNTPLGVPAMVGLLMLIGIVVTNAIVLIDLINQYRAKGEDLYSAVVDGARLRLRPIIMTAAATIFALIPMGLGLTGGGAFISRPLAVVVIGGLVSSTVLTLILVPVLYTLVERRSERRRQAARQSEADAETVPA
ncbi:MAG TPA: efflux RND transporter permease subunit [Propionibacteriaceae bacterium]|nr:efflux RND transporter permease subunit [Propionibacteriaceae bacterium]